MKFIYVNPTPYRVVVELEPNKSKTLAAFASRIDADIWLNLVSQRNPDWKVEVQNVGN